MGIASLVLGIISILLLFMPGYFFYQIIVGIVGIVLGALGRNVPDQKGMATAGLVCSIVGLGIGVLYWIACSAATRSVTSIVNAASTVQ